MPLAAQTPAVSAALSPAEAHERALLQCVANRDRGAFAELYTGYHRRLTRFLRRVTQRHELIDDVINDTFWLVWQKAGEFRGHSKVSTWIIGIAYRCALRALRRTGGATMAYEPDREGSEATAGPQPEAELRDWIDKAFVHLSPDQRVTLQLAYYLGHSLEEISEIMQCSVSTVKARMFHARVKLRALLPALGGMSDGTNAESFG